MKSAKMGFIQVFPKLKNYDMTNELVALHPFDYCIEFTTFENYIHAVST